MCISDYYGKKTWRYDCTHGYIHDVPGISKQKQKKPQKFQITGVDCVLIWEALIYKRYGGILHAR